MRSRWIQPHCSLWACLALTAATIGCGKGADSPDPPPANIPSTAADAETTTPSNDTELSLPTPSRELTLPVATTQADTSAGAPHAQEPELHPRVLIKTSLGDITLELDADKAPVTVENFLDRYVEEGFYNQTIFHYVESGFMIAGGGYTSDLKPKQPGPEILNEANNGLKNVRGSIAMARHPDYINSATSQFYINLVDNPSLDHHADSEDAFGYCVFGKVVAGLDVVDRIAQAKVHDVDVFPKVPETPIVVQSISRIR